jgi:hypothetical protein
MGSLGEVETVLDIWNTCSNAHVQFFITFEHYYVMFPLIFLMSWSLLVADF